MRQSYGRSCTSRTRQYSKTSTTASPHIVTKRSVTLGALLGAAVMVANTWSVFAFQCHPIKPLVKSWSPQFRDGPSDYIAYSSDYSGLLLSSTTLFMGKLRSRQAELQKKMALAKKQNANKDPQQDPQQSSLSDSHANSRLSDEEMKKENDRKRFEELLRGSQVFSGDDDYLNEQQEEETIDAYRRGADRLFEGDPAPTAAFEELISIKSENAIGETGAKRLVPWMRNTGSDDFLVIICDPRVKSPEFRDAVKAVRSGLPKDISSKIVFINADTPAENRRFLKKNNLMDSGIKLFSDEKREWMQAYTALGDNRWSMTMFIISNERIQKLVRELSSVDASLVVEKALRAMEKRKL
ncbi:hypothetical protein IV203_007327 [Nitzschia inconspicua]|uniref:Uncharacterized protein n=1 Tax=Nitzschia inconspicua TaxID=303405 RepID=A0A9K3PCU8_9STRA|nr:hypothetical protein IV203_007327 [Nitzschia inconspicua]